MTQEYDRLLQALARLPLIEPDMEWESRLRASCHSALSKRASRQVRAGRNLSGTGLIDLAAATALCVYLAAVLAEAARFTGLV